MAKLASNILVRIVCFSFSVLFFCAVPTVFSDASFQRLYLPGYGPESSAFDLAGIGPYTGITDGRILKYLGPVIGFVTYAYTAKNRPAKLCDGTNNTNLAQTCGRVIGLGFYYKTGQLFVADASYGLLVVEPGGGLAKQLVTGADGVPFKFCDGLEVDQKTGIVYFTDASANYNISQIAEASANGDMSGRLLKYDPKTKDVTVLVSGLGGPAGVAISADGSYLLFTEFFKNRVQKYWLRGPKENTVEVLLNLSGTPDNIKRNAFGDFWIAVTVQSQGTILLQGQRITGNGILLQTLTFSPKFNTTSISEVNEYRGYLFLGSLYGRNIGVKKYLA